MDLQLTDLDLANGFTGKRYTRNNALIIPGDAQISRPRQVIDPSTNEILYLDQSLVEQMTSESHIASLDIQIEKLPGQYIFGGYVRNHFGHFLVECLAPIWTIDHAPKPLDGIIFLPYHAASNTPQQTVDILTKHAGIWLGGLGVDLPVKVITKPTQVDCLTVGENAFGFGGKFSGSSFFRDFIRKRNILSPSHLAKSPRRKVYISRSRLGLRKAHLVGEEYLERTFEAAGYEIYWPEKNSIAEQMKMYQTASTIVAVEGSALHLPPFSCPEGCRFAIISRRSTEEKILNEFGTQIEAFVGTKPFVTFDVAATLGAPKTLSSHMLAHSVIDFDSTYSKLIDAKFLPENASLFQPSAKDFCDHLRRASLGSLHHLHIIGLDQDIENTKLHIERVRKMTPEQRRQFQEEERARKHVENWKRVMEERTQRASETAFVAKT